MLKLKIYGRVTDEMSRLMISDRTGSDELAFSLNSVKQLIENNPGETDIELEIHGCGGSVNEGFAVYDYLRTSGKNIHANVIGECHSMFLTLLLAAPIENRSANPNVSALAHRVNTVLFGVYSSKQIEDVHEMMAQDEEKIINVYVDRTNMDVETARAVIDAEKELTAKELLDYGFISKINEYNTNFFRNMNEDQIRDVLQRANAIVTAPIVPETPKQPEVTTKNVFKVGDSPMFEYTALNVGSEVVFSNEQTGGVFRDGDNVIVITDSKITDVLNLDEIRTLRSENESLTGRIASLENEAANSKTVISDMQKVVNHLQQNVRTNGQPQFTTAVTSNTNETPDPINTAKVDKSAVAEQLASFKSGKRNKKG